MPASLLKEIQILFVYNRFSDKWQLTANAINTELDRLTQGLQEVDDKISYRVLRVDDWQSTPSDFTIPSTRANQYLKFDSSGNITVSDSFVGNTITTTGNVSVGGTLSVTGTTTLAAVTASGNITGTLATAAQPNITSIGTLSSLTVDNLTLNDNQIASSTGTIALDDNITVNGNSTISGSATISGNITATNIAGTLTTAAQTNITSLGTLTALTVDNLNLNSNVIASDNGTIALDDNVTVNGNITATNIAGTLTTAAQSNITSLGTLTNLDVDNININLNTISATSGNLSLNNVTSFTVDNINLDGNTISVGSGNLTLTAAGDIDVNSNKLINVSDPISNTDAATKGWVNTTLANAGVSVGGSPTYQSVIANGSSRVDVVTSDGDTHIVNASTTLYKFEADEVEIDNPIRITKVGGYFAHRNTLDTGTFTTQSGYVNFMISPITINNGATVTISDGSDLRLI